MIFNLGFSPMSFYPLAYLIFPFLVWGALRFDQRMVVLLTLLVSVIAIAGTMLQVDRIVQPMLWNRLLFLWTYIATITITALLLAATLSEHRTFLRTVNSLEERFTKVFHAAPVGISLTTLEGAVFVDVNAEFCRITGYESDEVIGRSAFDLNLWEKSEVRSQLIDMLSQQGRISQTEIRMRVKSGRLVDGVAALEVIELAGKSHLLIMLQDITARLQTEEALRQSETRYRELFEGIDDAIFVHDMQANILDVNEVACRRLGYTREELLKMKITEIDAPGFAEGFAERLQQQLTRGSLSQIEGKQMTKDGREIFIDVNTKLITYKGQPAILAVDRDITDRKLAEQKLRESEARYRAVVEDQTEMICRSTPDRLLTFVNDAYCRFWGKSREELIGSSFIPNIYEEDKGFVDATMRSLTVANPVSVSENRGVHAGRLGTLAPVD